MNHRGEFGVATNIDVFSFVVCLPQQSPIVYLVERQGNQCVYAPASQQWMDEYMHTRMVPLTESEDE